MDILTLSLFLYNSTSQNKHSVSYPFNSIINDDKWTMVSFPNHSEYISSDKASAVSSFDALPMFVLRSILSITPLLPCNVVNSLVASIGFYYRL